MAARRATSLDEPLSTMHRSGRSRCCVRRPLSLSLPVSLSRTRLTASLADTPPLLICNRTISPFARLVPPVLVALLVLAHPLTDQRCSTSCHFDRSTDGRASGRCPSRPPVGLTTGSGSRPSLFAARVLRSRRCSSSFGRTAERQSRLARSGPVGHQGGSSRGKSSSRRLVERRFLARPSLVGLEPAQSDSACARACRTWLEVPPLDARRASPARASGGCSVWEAGRGLRSGGRGALGRRSEVKERARSGRHPGVSLRWREGGSEARGEGRKGTVRRRSTSTSSSCPS